jgi:hypothetical protein
MGTSEDADLSEVEGIPMSNRVKYLGIDLANNTTDISMG